MKLMAHLVTDNALGTWAVHALQEGQTHPCYIKRSAPQAIPITGISGVESLTAKMVKRVRNAWEKNNGLYERIFSEIDGLTPRGC
ncbi:MAG: hypothetical protein R3C68_10100 [Myxococcota bacterium]